LIADGVLRQAGRAGLGIFSIAPIGLSLSLVGTSFVLLVGNFLLPARPGGEGSTDRFRLQDYLTELTILPDSPFLGKTVAEVEADKRHQLKVVGWLREGRRLRLPFKGRRLREGDVLLVRTTPEDIVGIRQEPDLELQPVVKQSGPEPPRLEADQEERSEQLAQAVIAPGSRLIGRTLGEIDFRRRYGAIVGLWRKEGWLEQELAKTKLRPGDVLVLQGDESSLSRVERDRAILMMVPFQEEARLRRKAPLAGLIMLATIIIAAFNVLTIEIATLAGAATTVLAGCLTARQAYRAIDTRVYVFIAGAIPLGAAMQKSGAADLVGGWLHHAVSGWDQTLILLALFGVVAVLTQFMSDSATTALFAPVAVALAQALGKPPEPYVITVAMAAVAAFLTPIGRHGNLLVYGPGRYRFVDFIRAGTPLTVLVAFIVALLAQQLWPG
ncbi:MAG TPA: SLC13 family permease, partial [Caldilineaceae bacterium]|nr:SLC13 family permease [Caldilineaceae bacterium]